MVGWFWNVFQRSEDDPNRDNGEIGKSGPIVLYCDYFGKGLLEESSGRDQEAAEG